ncbi:MAG: transcriptional regulator NrdR [candidate division WOR-3 bacterium]
MKCPFCEHLESKVIDSRMTADNSAIRRRRECENCHRRFTTYERLEEIPIVVIKKDGRREIFDRNKIITGALKACEKRPVELKQIEQIVDEVEREIHNRLVGEITSLEIGEMVMEHLRKLDEVAYIRFASVYKEFSDARKFLEEVSRLKEKR